MTEVLTSAGGIENTSALSTDFHDEFRAVLGSIPKSVSVVTSCNELGPCGMTASAVCSASLKPPMVLVCFGNHSRTLDAAKYASRFAVNVLMADQVGYSKQFAERDEGQDKFAGIPYSLDCEVPILLEALVWLVCDLVDLRRVGDHTVAIGAVHSISSREGEPLVWHRGSYKKLI